MQSKFFFDEIELIILSKDELERFFSLNDKGIEGTQSDEEYEELMALYKKGREQYKKIEKNK